MNLPRPCIHPSCGELVTGGSRCPEHRIKRKGTQHHPHLNSNRWKRLSKRLRKASPFCELCGATERLAVDHIIPLSEDPTLAFAVENTRVLCVSCNATRKDHCTDEERQDVLARIAQRKRRISALH